jgi:hypothetical protein
MEHGQIPGGSATRRDATTQQRRVSGQEHEIKESVEHGVEKVKRVGEQIYDKACDACHNWKHYPKLVMTVLLLTTFLTGAFVAGGVQKMGFLGGSRHYVSSHWDRETADAHHALDVVLDHLQHPHLYEGQQATSYASRARGLVMRLVEGMLPSRGKARGMYEGARDTGRDIYDKAADTGRNLYDKVTGRSIYDKATGRGVMDKAGDIKDDLAYRARYGIDAAKETGYGIGHKLSDMAESVKKTFTGDRGSVSSGGRGRISKESESSGWFGHSEDDAHHGHDDEFELAQQKLQRINRHAEREM